MPTYEYECECCGHRFERFQKFTDPPVRECPRCGEEVHRLMGTGSGVIFKGPGFYATDYRDDGQRSGDVSKKGSSGGEPEKKNGKPDSDSDDS